MIQHQILTEPEVMCITSDWTCPLLQKLIKQDGGRKALAPRSPEFPADVSHPLPRCSASSIGLSLSTAEEVQLDTSFITMLSLVTPLLQAHFLFLSVLWPVVLLFPGGNLDLQKNYQISWSSSQSNSNKSQEQVQFLSSPSPLLVPPVPHDGRRLLFHYQEISFCLLWESGFFACS